MKGPRISIQPTRGEYIALRCSQLGITETDLYQRVGATQTTLWRFKTGETEPECSWEPETTWFWQAAKILKTSPKFLLSLPPDRIGDKRVSFNGDSPHPPPGAADTYIRGRAVGVEALHGRPARRAS